MAGIVKITITLAKGGGSREVIIDPDEIPMGFNEDLEAAQASGKWSELNQVFAEFLGLSRDEFRQVKQGDFKRIMEAVRVASAEATAVPNA